jgi:hypothetical protein
MPTISTVIQAISEQMRDVDEQDVPDLQPRLFFGRHPSDLK